MICTTSAAVPREASSQLERKLLGEKQSSNFQPKVVMN